LLFILRRQSNKVKPVGEILGLNDTALLGLKTPEGRALWKNCWLYYGGLQFVGVPLLFLPLGLNAALFVLINSLLAEVLTNIHSFVMIVPNHAGEDLYRFKGAANGKAEFYLRQIIASTNYKCGTDLNDFFHGWLNYQIEHHLWPNLTLRQYQILQPQVKALCEKYGIPYAQESIVLRLKKMANIYAGTQQMKFTPTASELFSSARMNSGPELNPLVF
jgi:fatty acid desaturase